MRPLLNEVAANCNLPSRFFRLENGKLLVQPDADADYESVDCGVIALHRIRGLPPTAFVGNECYVGRKGC